jgi:hypothetical protein
MPDRGDYLPRKEAESADWLDNFSAEAQGNDAKWRIPKTETDKIAGLTACKPAPSLGFYLLRKPYFHSTTQSKRFLGLGKGVSSG